MATVLTLTLALIVILTLVISLATTQTTTLATNEYVREYATSDISYHTVTVKQDLLKTTILILSNLV